MVVLAKQEEKNNRAMVATGADKAPAPCWGQQGCQLQADSDLARLCLEPGRPVFFVPGEDLPFWP